MIRRVAAGLVLSAALPAVGATPAPEPATARVARILFVGNSLTDHWNQSDARRAIREGGWSAVVLQQGPSALPESWVLLVRYAELFAAEAEKIGARTALYMVWPSRARAFDFAGVAAYAEAARAVDGVLLPAGAAWGAAWKLDAGLALYGAGSIPPRWGRTSPRW